ncbi:helix-turn-helix domain-containing protein [Salmonella enterica]|nr:helix-turn-helix domain-containing protein [Salmonella enterica]
MHNSRNPRSLSLTRIAARAQGCIGGRRPALFPDEIAQLSRLIKNGYSRKQLSIVYNVSLSTIYKYSTPEFTDLPQTTTQLLRSHNTQ